LILIGTYVIPELNYINQIKDSTMVNSQNQIFSDLKQNDIVALEISLKQLFSRINTIAVKKDILKNAGVNDYFINEINFEQPTNDLITVLVSRFKEYRVYSRKPDYHPLIIFLEYLILDPEKYNLDDQAIATFTKIVSFGKEKIQALSTENLSIKPNSKPVIGIITALEKEYVAVKAVFEQGREDTIEGRGAGRRYWLTDVTDRQGTSRTMAVTLADMGNNVAAVRATTMLSHYPTVQSIIMCGIAGGVPHPTKVEDHVRLGDIVISDKKGIVQYDFDKESEHFTEIRAMPVAASADLVEAVRYLRADEMFGQRPWDDFILKTLQKLNWQRPSQETDLLYSSEQTDEIITHPEDLERKKDRPKIFLGAIGSANKLLKNPQKRDLLREQFGVKAIEMEGSGVADASWNQGVGYIVVRGICDYCDSHKSDIWQQYAAVVAAAYVRALLESI
jgi:nucleoside phosphorylase